MGLSNIKRVGDQLHLVNDDGTVILAYPTSTELWLVAGASEPGPGPNPGGVPFIWPVPLSSVSSEYGPRSGGYSSVHQGIDLAPGAGYQIKAAGSGRVYQSGWHNNFGNRLTIEHNVNGQKLYTLYAHMQNPPLVGNGAAVNQGQHIGNVGNTGASFGAHLHFETHVGGLNWNNPGSHMNPRLFYDRYNK